MSGSRNTALFCFLMAACLMPSCGNADGERIVLTRKEPRTLLTQGTALTQEEADRRKEAKKATQAQAAAGQKLLKAISKLESAKDTETILVGLGRFKKLGPAAKGYYAKLERWLTHKDMDVRCAALAALTAIDPMASYRTHLDALKDDDDLVRRRAVALWAEYRSDNLKALLPLLDDIDSRVQYQTLQAIASGDPDQETLERIAKSVDDLDGSSAKAALNLLLPKRAEVASFDTMVELLLDHQDETARLRCAESLRRAKVMNHKIATKVVYTALEDPSESVRRACYIWLKELSPVAPPAYDPLADDESRYAARVTLLDFLKTVEGKWGP